MVRRLIAATLSAALVLLSPGHDAGAAFAAVIAAKTSVPAFNGAGAAAATAPRRGSLNVLSLSAPSLAPMPGLLPLAPSIALPAPGLTRLAVPAAADAPRPGATVPEMGRMLAAPLAAASDAQSGDAASRGSAQQIEDVITGGRSTHGAGDASVAGAYFGGIGALSAAADAPAAPSANAAPAKPAAPAVKVVNSRLGYALHRFMLGAIASLTGAVHSLPAAGENLSNAALWSARSKRVVISDFDDTLAKYNETLSPEMISAISAVRAAGKEFVVISDRGDEKRAHQLTVFESLETMPVSLRAGMYVAANSGGRVYRYDEQGVPQRVFEYPALAAERKTAVEQAAAATKERMKTLGAEQHDPIATGNNNPAESWNTYGYAMMLKIGSSEGQVRGAAAFLQEELAKRGIEAEVNPRFAKDPANPPYISFSVVTKQPATAFIAQALGATARDTVFVGDSQYVPREAKRNAGGFLDRLGAKLSGRPLPQTGNATDRNMEKALPGALVIAVGHNADPRMKNAWVTAVKGPQSTRRMLMAVASQPASEAKKSSELLKDIVAIVSVIALAAVSVGAAWMLLSAVGEILTLGEAALRNLGTDDFFMMGAIGLAFGALKPANKPGDKKPSEDKPLSRLEAVGTAILLAVSLAGSLFMLYLLYSSIGQIGVIPIELPPGWQGPIPDGGWENLFQSIGIGGAALGAGMMMRPAVLDNPGASYARGLEVATKIAAERGVAADAVLFVQATAVMPLHQGKQWHYQFALPRANGKNDLVYVDFERNLTTVGVDHRVSIYENVGVLPEGAVVKALTPYLAGRGLVHTPQAALDALRAQHPGFGTSVSVALRLEQTDGLDPWYRFYDNNGAQAAVNARTREIAVTVAPAANAKKPGLTLTGKILIAAALAALAYALFTGQFAMAAGFALSAGVIQKVGAASDAVTDEDVRSTAGYVISYKGRPWSSTEFNSVYYPALENLKARGATPAQVELFEKLVNDAPVKGGSFNPWSGD